jgi:two-component system cell cycle response regulator DivK
MSSKPSVLVLVVDDSPDGREMLVEYLAFRRFQVAEARNGAEAIDVARRVRPSIILMDLSMPGMDGWEATRRLKADPLTQSAVIVAVTAHAFPREQEAARAAGCDIVIAKPFDLTVLADALEAIASHGLTALGSKAGAVTARSQPVSLTTGDASAAKDLGIRSPSPTDARSPRKRMPEESSR